MIADGCSTFARFLAEVGLPLLAALAVAIVIALATVGVAALWGSR